MQWNKQVANQMIITAIAHTPWKQH